MVTVGRHHLFTSLPARATGAQVAKRRRTGWLGLELMMSGMDSLGEDGGYTYIDNVKSVWRQPQP